MRDAIKYYLTKAGNCFLRDATRRTLDNAALIRMSSLIPADCAWTQSAVAPRALAVLMNEVIIHGRKSVLECGSGISTLILGHVLAGRGGRIISIDHDEGWQAVVSDMCSELSNVEFIHAPLEQGKCFENEWYQLKVIGQALQGLKFDMLFVDAPLGYKFPGARYPAVPCLNHYLADDFSIFLDDANRSGERFIANRWAVENNLELQFMDVVADLALLYPKGKAPRFNIC